MLPPPSRSSRCRTSCCSRTSSCRCTSSSRAIGRWWPTRSPAIGSSAWCCCGPGGKPTTRAGRRSTRSAAPGSSPTPSGTPTAATTSSCAGWRSSASRGEDRLAQLSHRARSSRSPKRSAPEDARHRPVRAPPARSAAGAAAGGARRRSESAAVDVRRGSRQRAGAVSRARAGGKAGAARARGPRSPAADR